MNTRKVDVEITEPDGTVVFSKEQVEVPAQWSDRAATIAASKYFSYNEDSILTVVGRIARQIMLWGEDQKYFDDEEQANRFMDSLENIMLNQRAAFNSPVWFNIGVSENDNQVAGCFIYGVEDNMEDILEHSKREGLTFKNGSGAGVNVSSLRAKGELLSNRGMASGPISFMRIWDQTANSIKSGGKTRRSAKMVVMDINHPDIEEFIACKLHEEQKALALMASGISHEEAYSTVAFQNANHSVMVTDVFMEAVKDDTDWDLINRGDGKVSKIIKARDLFRKIAEVAHATGDPGIQFYDRINNDNPVPTLGNIVCSNPCAEHVAINNSACNLASLNLVAYLNKDGTFNREQFIEDIYVMITAQDIMINKADYPTVETKQTAIDTRPLGLGFTNLGAYLMLQGLPYDSEEARKEAKSLTLLMTTAAYNISLKLAENVGPFNAYDENNDRCVEIALKLTNNAFSKQAIKRYGLRNSQLTLLAPTGTISFLMDCDTTGIEPLYALKAQKRLAGGGTMNIAPSCVKDALAQRETVTVANLSTERTQSDLEISHLSKEEQTIFKTANEITPHDHILMMAACQKHLNGAISKTVNMSAEATVEDIMQIYQTAWLQELKSIAIYRDGSKQLQPLTIESDDNLVEEDEEKWTAYRKRLPNTRRSETHKFNVAGLEGYLTYGMYDDGELGEIFIRTQKMGSTVQGFLDGLSIAVSLGLQYGVPLEIFVDKFTNTRFEPAGFTTNEEIRMATSVTDYIFRYLKLQFMDDDDDELTIEETDKEDIVLAEISFDGPPCPKCQAITGRHGACYLCPQCGETTGCS